MWLVLLATLVLVAIPSSWAHRCIQDEVFNIKDVMSKRQTYASSYPTINNTQPIRLRVDTSYLANDVLGFTCTQKDQVVDISTPGYVCSSSDVLTSSLRSYLQSLLNSAQSLWQSSLKVMPVQGPLKLVGSSSPVGGLIGGISIPTEYTSTGAQDIDVVIFVTARPIIQSGGATSTLAVAKVVQEDQIGRPVMGHLNINPAGIDVSAAMYKRNFGVVVHEMTHALGFTINKLRNVNPNPSTGITSLVKDVTLTVAAKNSATTRSIVYSPNVLAWAKSHYGCDSIQGVELENQGGSGTAYSHWEKRTTYNEYMTGTASRNPVFSDLTLALMQDTGWYLVNNSLTSSLLWGRGMGCDFTSRSCENWPDYNGYFCSSNGAQGCTADHQAKGSCQIGTATVSSDYQYFSDATKVGYYELPDFCPVTWGYENGWCFDTGAATSSLVNKGEVFGENSRCFDSSLVKDLPVGGSSGSTCYETYCTGPLELRIKIGDYWYLCPPASEIKVVGFGGVVTCPDKIQQVCAGSANDTTWPIFISISPDTGGPGLQVNITGKNFLDGATVSVGGDTLSDITVLSSTLISATIPNSDRFKNPTNLISQPASVVITDAKGRSAVGYNSFTIKVKLNSQFIKNAFEYLKDNPIIAAAIIGAIVITCFICCYCCYRQKGDAEEADTQEYYDRP